MSGTTVEEALKEAQDALAKAQHHAEDDELKQKIEDVVNANREAYEAAKGGA